MTREQRVEEIRERRARLPFDEWQWDWYSLLSPRGPAVEWESWGGCECCGSGISQEERIPGSLVFIEYAPEDVAFLLSELDRAMRVVAAGKQLAKTAEWIREQSFDPDPETGSPPIDGALVDLGVEIERFEDAVEEWEAGR